MSASQQVHLLMTSKSIERFKQEHHSNVTEETQTDHAVEKCVAIGAITCTARSDSV